MSSYALSSSSVASEAGRQRSARASRLHSLVRRALEMPEGKYLCDHLDQVEGPPPIRRHIRPNPRRLQQLIPIRIAQQHAAAPLASTQLYSKPLMCDEIPLITRAPWPAAQLGPPNRMPPVHGQAWSFDIENRRQFRAIEPLRSAPRAVVDGDRPQHHEIQRGLAPRAVHVAGPSSSRPHRPLFPLVATGGRSPGESGLSAALAGQAAGYSVTAVTLDLDEDHRTSGRLVCCSPAASRPSGSSDRQLPYR